MRDTVTRDRTEADSRDAADEAVLTEPPRRRGVAGAMDSLRSWFSKRFPLEPPLE